MLKTTYDSPRRFFTAMPSTSHPHLLDIMRKGVNAPIASFDTISGFLKMTQTRTFNAVSYADWNTLIQGLFEKYPI